MILLDTQIWVNWILLGRDALKLIIASAIENADRVVVSAISCFEVTLLGKCRKLEFSLSTHHLSIKKAREQSDIECLPIICSIEQLFVKLTDIHSNSVDRMIIATTLEQGAQLASYITAFSNYLELSGYLLKGSKHD